MVQIRPAERSSGSDAEISTKFALIAFATEKILSSVQIPNDRRGHLVQRLFDNAQHCVFQRVRIATEFEPLDRLDADIAGMRAAMAEASRIVLNGFELGTDVSTVRYPERYADKRGVKMWDEVTSLINQFKAEVEVKVA